MPYIPREARRGLPFDDRAPDTPGELNFCICDVVDDFLIEHGVGYTTLNSVIGDLELVKAIHCLGIDDDEFTVEHENVYNDVADLVAEYLEHVDPPTTQVLGVLTCVQAEVYRRILAPYEDEKCADNGDVFFCIL